MTQHHAPSGAHHHAPVPGQIPPGVAFPGHPTYDPKAAAKAAKAYAKAQRPWFKKKRFILPLGFIALIVVVSLSSGGDDTSGRSVEPAKVGDTVTLEGTRYTVDKVRTTKTLGEGFLAERAHGRFVVITVTLENIKDNTRTFSDTAATLVTTSDKTYETTTDAMFLVEDNLFLEEMQPDLPTTGTIVFDVPTKAMKGMLLKVSDLFGRGEAYVDLGL